MQGYVANSHSQTRGQLLPEAGEGVPDVKNAIQSNNAAKESKETVRNS